MSSYVRKKSDGNTDWFYYDRFGMFIHFGLYALPARGEWVQNFELIDNETYNKYFEHFNPDLLNAKEWAKRAKEAGMKYAILTTKHHEGFCLWDTKYTEFKVTNTPYKKDIVREFVDAFKAEGLKVGFYYSLLDWNSKLFPIDAFHPLCEHPDAEKINEDRDMKKYAEYMRNQVRELLTNYGKIDIIWFDFSYEKNNSYRWKDWMLAKGKNEWESEKMIELVRSLQPEIIINNRLEIEQDVLCPEQVQPEEWYKDKDGNLLLWEVCQTFSGSWGYHRTKSSWKTPKQLIKLLTRSVSVGGNVIMNVGPNARGLFDERANEALKVYADWIKLNGRSIYGCTMPNPEFSAPNGCHFTQNVKNEKLLYLHIHDHPFSELYVKIPFEKISYAQLLEDASEIKIQKYGSESSCFTLPDISKSLDPVIEIFLK